MATKGKKESLLDKVVEGVDHLLHPSEPKADPADAPKDPDVSPKEPDEKNSSGEAMKHHPKFGKFSKGN